MEGNSSSVLIIGYGNPGRQDDGLGPSMIKKLMEAGFEVTLEDPYQLTVEDTITVSQNAVVIFVDAALDLKTEYTFTRLQPCPNTSINSHSISPEALLQLSKTLYDHVPEAYMLAINGREFDRFEEQLSPIAESNLEQAYDFLEAWLSDAGVERCMN